MRLGTCLAVAAWLGVRAPLAMGASTEPAGVPPAAGAVAASRVPCPCVPSEPRRQLMVRDLEFSFGSAQKFFDQSVTDPAGIVRSRTIPVTTVSVFGEWLFWPRLGVMVLFDLPLEPRATLVEEELRLEYVPPSLSAGLRGSALSLDVLDKTVLDWQFFALLGSTLAGLSGDAAFPSLGSRFHLRDDGGFTLYAGGSFEFRLKRSALIYGVGHRF